MNNNFTCWVKTKPVSVQIFNLKLQQIRVKSLTFPLVPLSSLVSFFGQLLAKSIRANKLYRYRDDHRQCDQIWQNFATCANFQKSKANFRGYILRLATFKSYFGRFSKNFGQIRTVVSSQIMKNIRAIWSHWLIHRRLSKISPHAWVKQIWLIFFLSL